MVNKRTPIVNKRTPINQSIRDRELRVIGPDNTQLGILSREEALSIAEQHDLDLVVVARNSQPPVARIVDWGKYTYQRDKKLQGSRKASKASELKQMRFGLKIGDHDIEVKLRKVSEFLDKDFRVKLGVFLRGREMEHKDLAFDFAKSLVDKLNEESRFNGNIVVEQPPKLSGRLVNQVIRNSGKPRTGNAKNQEPQRHQGPNSSDQKGPTDGP